jgi:hypothetical protein
MSTLLNVDGPDVVKVPTTAPEAVTNPSTAPLEVREVHTTEPLMERGYDDTTWPEENDKAVPLDVGNPRLATVLPPADKDPETVSGVEIVSPPEEYERMVPEVPTVKEPSVPPPADSVPQYEPETVRVPREPELFVMGREDVIELQSKLPDTVMAEEMTSEPEL